MKPPTGFEELASVAEKGAGSEFCAVGVVADFLPPTKSRGQDYVITFTLTDRSWFQGEGLKCRFFGRTEDKLPNIISKGDVVVLRSTKLRQYNGQLMALSSFQSSWLVFHQQDIPLNDTEVNGVLPFSKMSDQTPSPGKDIIDYAVEICNFLDRSTFGEPAPVTSLQASSLMGSNGAAPSPAPKKFQLIQDLTLPRTTRDLKFADLLGEVRKVYMNDFRVELSITDYTSHESLYNYAHTLDDEQGRDGDEFNYIPGQKPWSGPWGKMSMVVTAWDSHANFARKNVGLGNIVFLRNVQISLDREGDRMEGNLRGDRYHPDRIGISICKPRQAQDDDRIKALLKRKRDYEADLKLHGIRGMEESNKPKDEAVQQPAKQPELTAREKKKQRQKERRKAKQKEAQKARANTSKSASESLNPNIRTNKVPETITPVKISEITDPSVLHGDFTTPAGNPFTVPFKNNLYHLNRIRVIDFHPPNIADFAAPHKRSDYECLSDYESDSDISMDLTDPHGAEVEWEWRFELLVEDASSPAPQESGRMKLLVAGPDADFLLRSIRATNLREDEKSLAKLKEKLFLLWGDLQERKEEEEGEKEAKEEGVVEGRLEPSGRPFECLVKEYGVQARHDGAWERVFALFGTSIVSD
ncbi:hypothetical protein EPUS_00588 [Endocarpon pusillum Z07020]|uniref:Protection of telomeres protein 1 n=1 Tax=Endocarpon pusillum (strain Z07020 / HMAS-L-300199) TaxID=1263415 RepID=U1HR65_ENDPU|nr:uncharacterized protein EPUS_00588 [Endocarpon pusillum Z07020]ERF71599.1 hypothetical protein EPUS_00588 [Endocarpon pusillum Z07020]